MQFTKNETCSYLFAQAFQNCENFLYSTLRLFMLQLLSVMSCQEPTVHHLADVFYKGRDIFCYPTPTCHKLPHNRLDSTWQFSSGPFLPCGPFTSFIRHCFPKNCEKYPSINEYVSFMGDYAYFPAPGFC